MKEFLFAWVSYKRPQFILQIFLFPFWDRLILPPLGARLGSIFFWQFSGTTDPFVPLNCPKKFEP